MFSTEISDVFSSKKPSYEEIALDYAEAHNLNIATSSFSIIEEGDLTRIFHEIK